MTILKPFLCHAVHMNIYPVHCTKFTMMQRTWPAYRYHLVFLIWCRYLLFFLICCPNIWTSPPLFWIWRCFWLLWTLHCPKGRHCDVTMIRSLLFHGKRADLSGSPGAAIVNLKICWISKCYVAYFREMTPYIQLDTHADWVDSSGYSINARAEGHLIELLARLASPCWQG